MATRQYYYQESLSRSTTTSTSDQTKVTLTFTPDANAVYLIVATALLDYWYYNGTAYSCVARLKEDGAEVAQSFGGSLDGDPIPRFGACMATILEAGASPSSVSYTLTYTSLTASYTAGIQDATIFAIRLESGDEYYYGGSASTSTNHPTYTTGGTLTFTPPSTADYLIFARQEVRTSGYAHGNLADVFVDGTQYSSVYRCGQTSTANYGSMGFMRLLNLTNASHTINTKFCRWSGTGTTYNRRNVIVAFLASNFEWADGISGGVVTTSTTYVEGTQISTTAIAVPHWSFYGGGVYNNSATPQRTTYGNPLHDSAAVSSSNFQHQSTVAYHGAGMCFQRVHTPTAGTRTWSVQAKTTSGGTAVYGSQFGVVQLEAAASGATIPRKLSTIESVYGAVVAQELIG